MTKIVDSKVCPFRLRRYYMSEPSNVLLTESFFDIIDLAAFLKKFDGRGESHVNDCHNLLVQILYALEVNYRLGIRHNDLHLHNVMIQFCDNSDKVLKYLTRNKVLKKNILMKNCTFMIKLFDNDRVTKLEPKNELVDSKTFWKEIDSRPVLNLFPWHEPSVYTEKLDLFKIMQHIREDTKSHKLKKMIIDLHVSLSQSTKQKLSLMHGRNNFMNYHLVTVKNKRKEPFAVLCNDVKNNVACTKDKSYIRVPSFPKWLDDFNSSEQAIMTLSAYTHVQKLKKNHIVVGDMSKLYNSERRSNH